MAVSCRAGDRTSGFSTPAKDFGTGTDTTSVVAIGDLNGDGNLALGDKGGQNIVYFGNGTGLFPTSTSFGPGNDGITSIVLADINGDGSLDIVAASDTVQDYVYLNQGGDIRNSTSRCKRNCIWTRRRSNVFGGYR